MAEVWLKVKGWFLLAGAALLALFSAFLYGRRKGTTREGERRDAAEKTQIIDRVEKKQDEQHKVQEIKNDVNRMSDADVDERGDDKWMRD